MKGYMNTKLVPILVGLFVLILIVLIGGRANPITPYIYNLDIKTQAYSESFGAVQSDIVLLSEDQQLLSDSAWMANLKLHIVNLNGSIYTLASSTTDVDGEVYALVNNKVLELAIETRLFTNAYDKQVLISDVIYIDEMVLRIENIDALLKELIFLLDEYK